MSDQNPSALSCRDLNGQRANFQTLNFQALSRRALLPLILGAGVAGCQTTDTQKILGDVIAAAGGASGGGGLTNADYTAGIRAALTNGAIAAVSLVGQRDGYLRDGKIHIPLPGFLGDAQSTLKRVGLSGMLDTLEVQLNRGAEVAAPQAKNIFVNTISSISIADAVNIVRGPSNAATQYLKDRTTPRLVQLFSPIMTSALQRAGATQTYDQLVTRAQAFPFINSFGQNQKKDLIDHGIAKGLDGLFYYIGEEEAEIRANPAKRSSEILRRVFG